MDAQHDGRALPLWEAAEVMPRLVKLRFTGDALRPKRNCPKEGGSSTKRARLIDNCPTKVVLRVFYVFPPRDRVCERILHNLFCNGARACQENCQAEKR